MLSRRPNGGTLSPWINFNRGWAFRWSLPVEFLEFCRSVQTRRVFSRPNIFDSRNRWLSPPLLQFKTLEFTSAQKSTPPNSKPASRNCVRHRRPCNVWETKLFDLTSTERRER